MVSCTIHWAKCHLNKENHLHSHRSTYMIRNMNWTIAWNLFSGLDSSLLPDLREMIKSVNPYAHKYLQVGDTLTVILACDIKLVLRSPSEQVDPCRYNLPTGTDVAVIMPAETLETPCKRDVVVYKCWGLFQWLGIDENWYNSSYIWPSYVCLDVSIWW